MAGSYLLYNELHYNGLMTDLGLFPSLYHLEEYSLQEHTLLHLCVIVSNLAEMFFVVTLAKRLYSLLFLPSFLLLLSSCAHYKSFVFLLSQVSQQMELTALPHPQKQRIVLPKTTYRFTENNVSFC